jgi:hypothetical protein
VGKPKPEVVTQREEVRIPPVAHGRHPAPPGEARIGRCVVGRGYPRSMESIDINISADNPRMPRAAQLAMMLVTSSLKADEPENVLGREVFNDVISECATESLHDPEFQACLLVSLVRIVNVMADLAGDGMGITPEEVVQITAPILAAWTEPGGPPDQLDIPRL